MLTHIFATTLRNICGFDRRVRKRLSTGSYQVLQLASNHPDKYCKHRERVSADILLRKGHLDGTLGKLVAVFECELKYSASTGKCARQLYTLVLMACIIWDADSQAMEGVNSRIKPKSDKAHHIDLETINADIVTSNMVGLGVRGAPAKNSEVVKRSDVLLAIAAASYDRKQDDT